MAALGGGEVMELRWYQTYDENGVDSSETLQIWRQVGDDPDDGYWEDVPYVRERERKDG